MVVTVCDSALEEVPVWLGQGYRERISFPDPAPATDDEDQTMKVFRQVRNDIALKIPALLGKFNANNY